MLTISCSCGVTGLYFSSLLISASPVVFWAFQETPSSLRLAFLLPVCYPRLLYRSPSDVGGGKHSIVLWLSPSFSWEQALLKKTELSGYISVQSPFRSPTWKHMCIFLWSLQQKPGRALRGKFTEVRRLPTTGLPQFRPLKLVYSESPATNQLHIELKARNLEAYLELLQTLYVTNYHSVFRMWNRCTERWPCPINCPQCESGNAELRFQLCWLCSSTPSYSTSRW